MQSCAKTFNVKSLKDICANLIINNRTLTKKVKESPVLNQDYKDFLEQKDLEKFNV